MIDRVLALAGPDADAGWRINLFAFRLFMLLHAAGRTAISVIERTRNTPMDLAAIVHLYGMVLVLVAGCVPRYSLWATRAAALLVLGQILLPGTAMSLPLTANHLFLELIVLMFLALLNDRDDREAPLLLQMLRWMTAVFFFYAGVQKLLYGRYFDGQLLGYYVASNERFQAFFQYLLPAEEFARLQSVGGLAPGSGPYSVDSPLFLLISNSVYVFEMAAGVLLMVRRTRTLAAIGAILFVIMIELAARELTFGMLMINLLLLFAAGRWNLFTLPAFALAYAWLVAAAAGFVPMFKYSPA